MSDFDGSDFEENSLLENLNESWEKDRLMLEKSSLRSDNQYNGFDNNCGESWIYPTNYPVREYQYEITKKCLFKNTLVVLPTGLGKTFIAAVVMYNFYRWYPKGKIIFMAPTRPLVAQQIDACYQIMGIPKADTVELTGQQHKLARTKMWKAKRVFFITPQILHIDLRDPEVDFPVSDIRLIVVDEAHRAKGKYAYTQVIRLIAERHKFFRVLALSATPGKHQYDVTEVIKNLIISSMEVRTEDSKDVAPYTHKKNIETVVVPWCTKFLKIRERLLEIIEPYTKSLTELNILPNCQIRSRAFLVRKQQEFRENCMDHPQRSDILSDLSMIICLHHSLDLLERHGVRIFLNYFVDTDANKDKYFVWKIPHLKSFLDDIRAKFHVDMDELNNSTGLNDSRPNLPEDFDFGHPKYELLREKLLKHFEKHMDTRSIIFCEYRESVYLIHRMLLQNRPLIKPIAFVGQGGAKSVTQKQQKAIMNEFRNGLKNVLIATCVAEEGLDVGEVDLIICFDISTTNPTRMIQRIGRTGRKRDGKVLMFATEGTEQGVLRQALGAKNGNKRMLANVAQCDNEVFCNSPRLVPPEYDPQCMEVFIRIDGVHAIPKETNEFERSKYTSSLVAESAKSIRPRKGISSVKISAPNNRDLRRFFKPLNKQDQPAVIIPKPNLSESIDYDFEDDVVIVESPKKNLECAGNFDSNDRISHLLRSINHYKKSLKRAPIKLDKLQLEDLIRDNNCPLELKNYCTRRSVVLKETVDIGRQFPDDIDIECVVGKTNILDGHNNQQNLIRNVNLDPQISSPDICIPFPKLFEKLDTDSSVSVQLKALAKVKFDDLEPKLQLVDCEAHESSIETSVEVEPNYYIDSQFEVLRFQENESKYQNQAPSQTPNEPKKNEKFEKFKSSTPLVSTAKRRKIVYQTPLKNSPIVKAFNRSIGKKNLEMESLWKYFKVQCLDDIFADDFEFPTISAKSAETDTNQTTTLSKTASHVNTEITANKNDIRLSVSDIFADESFNFSKNLNSAPKDTGTQYTVTQIMQIVSEDLNKCINSQKSQTICSNRSFVSSKNLDIGTIEDIFDNEQKPILSVDADVIKTDASTSSIRLSKNIDIGSIDDIFDAENGCFSSSSNITEEEVDLIPASQPHPLKSKWPPLSSIKSTLSRLSSIKENECLSTDNPIAENLEIINIDSSSSESISSQKENYQPINSLDRKKNTIHSPALDHVESIKCLNNNQSLVDKSPSIIKRMISFTALQHIERNNHHQPLDDEEHITSDNMKDSDEWIGGTAGLTETKDKTNGQTSVNLEVTKLTGRGANRNSKRIVDSDSGSSCDEQVQPIKSFEFKKPRIKLKEKIRKRRPRCGFIDDECIVSGDISSDEAEDSQYLSQFVSNETFDDSNIDMRAKYLQSIRSPIKRPGTFHIPQHRKHRNLMDVFSQEVLPEEPSQYKEDSFVVSDEEEVLPENKELSVLEQAEMILKQRRKEKRKQSKDRLHNDIKRRKIIVLRDSSDDES